MNKKAYMPIREFAHLTGIRSANLRFYDQIGLLSPEFRADNNYRYYTRRQLNTAYLISSLRDLGVGLEEIKQYAGERTLDKMLELFAEQDKRITAELDRIHCLQEMVKIYTEMAQQAIKHHNEIFIEDCECEPIFITPESQDDLLADDEVILAYEYAEEHGISSGYPIGAILYQPDVSNIDKLKVLRYYFKTKRKHNSFKPAGRYAIAYGQCALGKSEAICKKLLEFISLQGFKMVGNIYEEYLLNELSLDDENSHCVRLAVRVLTELA